MKYCKRILPLFLALALSFTLIPTVALADSDGIWGMVKDAFKQEAQNVIQDGIHDAFDYIFNDPGSSEGGIEPNREPASPFSMLNDILVKYTGSGGYVVIPESVTLIAPSAFQDCTTLTGVVIPGSVKEIDAWAFDGCTNLTDLTISDGVEKIGQQAFWDCTNLTSVTIPDSVTLIDMDAFARCTALKDVTIPKGCRVLKGAFEDTPYMEAQLQKATRNKILTVIGVLAVIVVVAAVVLKKKGKLNKATADAVAAKVSQAVTKVQEAVKPKETAEAVDTKVTQEADKVQSAVKTAEGVTCSCGTVNEPGSKFCSGCGKAIDLPETCPACGHINDPDGKFCENCGKALTKK